MFRKGGGSKGASERAQMCPPEAEDGHLAVGASEMPVLVRTETPPCALAVRSNMQARFSRSKARFS